MLLRLDADVLQEKAQQAGHLTQEDIAGHAGIERSVLSRLLAGRTMPTLPTLVRLSRAYGVTIDDLVLDPEAVEVPA